MTTSWCHNWLITFWISPGQRTCACVISGIDRKHLTVSPLCCSAACSWGSGPNPADEQRFCRRLKTTSSPPYRNRQRLDAARRDKQPEEAPPTNRRCLLSADRGGSRARGGLTGVCCLRVNASAHKELRDSAAQTEPRWCNVGEERAQASPVTQTKLKFDDCQNFDPFINLKIFLISIT